MSKALFDKCLMVYKAMYRHADGDSGVYKGHLSKLMFNDLQLSNPYYTKITRKLKDMGCIEQTKRGNAVALSEWNLVKVPTWEDFISTPKRADLINQRLDIVETRLNKLDLMMNKIWEALRAKD